MLRDGNVVPFRPPPGLKITFMDKGVNVILAEFDVFSPARSWTDFGSHTFTIYISHVQSDW